MTKYIIEDLISQDFIQLFPIFQLPFFGLRTFAFIHPRPAAGTACSWSRRAQGRCGPAAACDFRAAWRRRTVGAVVGTNSLGSAGLWCGWPWSSGTSWYDFWWYDFSRFLGLHPTLNADARLTYRTCSQTARVWGRNHRNQRFQKMWRQWLVSPDFDAIAEGL